MMYKEKIEGPTSWEELKQQFSSRTQATLGDDYPYIFQNHAIH
jgi:hypothetical protein